MEESSESSSIDESENRVNTNFSDISERCKFFLIILKYVIYEIVLLHQINIFVLT